MGASLRETGSRASTGPASGSGPTGFDPARICNNCVHQAWGMDGSECERPLSNVRSLVSGEYAHRLNALCWNERIGGKTLFTRRQRCGPEGRYFEQAPPSIKSIR